MMLTELTPAPMAAAPIVEFAAHLRLPEGFADGSDEAPLLDLYLRAASACVEAMTGRALIARSFEWTVTAWRDAGRHRLPITPVRSVSSIVLHDRNQNETTVDADRYRLLDGCLTGAGGTLPSIPLDGMAVVAFEAGYGDDWNAVPPALRQAVLLLAAHYHEHRQVTELTGDAAPGGVLALIAPFRQVRL